MSEIISISVFYEFAAPLVLAAGVGLVGLALRQPLIVSFIAVGILAGPSVLHIARSPEHIQLLAAIARRLRRHGLRVLGILLEGEIREQMAARLRALPAGQSKVVSDVRLGEAVPVIEAATAEFRPDLLVVGTHGRTGVANAILGSIAGRLSRRPRCDVLAVRAW